MFTQKFIKLSAAVHELWCAQTYLPYIAMVKNLKIRSSDLERWPRNCMGHVRLSRNMLMQNFIRLSVVVHELSCKQRKKLRRKQYRRSLPRTV